MDADENFGKAIDFVSPRVNSWVKDLFGGVEQLNLTRPQKELIQALTAETLLYNTLMSNEEMECYWTGVKVLPCSRHQT